MLTTSIIFVLFILVLYQYYKRLNSDYWKKRNIPFVKKNNPIGIAWDVAIENASVVFKRIYDRYENERVVGVFSGTTPALLLKHPEDIVTVFSTDFQSFYKRGVSVRKDEILTNHILFIDEYKRWKILRQKMSPVFTSAKLKNMFYILERSAKDFSYYIDDNPDSLKDPFDLLSIYTAASIGSSVFGIDTRVKNTMQSPFIAMARDAVTPTIKKVINLILKDASEFMKDILCPRAFSDYEDFFVGTFKKVLAARRGEAGQRHDFIDVCLEIQKNGMMTDAALDYELEPSDEVLAAQAYFFFLAGVDTSAVTMHFSLLELANNQKILTRLHEEIDKVFDQCNDKLTFEDVAKLRYLEMVINESMRKYPTVGVVQRVCTNDTVLPHSNVPVQKGVTIYVPIYALHRDERYYPNPDLFDPERFSSDNIDKIVKYSYIPFGEGNRHCIGMRFARLQVLTGLAWLLRRYTLKPQEFQPQAFDRSFFALRASNAKVDLVLRDKYVLNK